MIVGVPKEIKNNEFRVSTTPSGVHAFVKAGHTVLVEKGAGLGSAVTDADYKGAGAQIVMFAGNSAGEPRIIFDAIGAGQDVHGNGFLNGLPGVLRFELGNRLIALNQQ